jgi:hypothetical protein
MKPARARIIRALLRSLSVHKASDTWQAARTRSTKRGFAGQETGGRLDTPEVMAVEMAQGAADGKKR